MTTPLNRYWRYIQCSLHFVNSHRGGLDFTLPPIKARHVGLAESDAVPAKPDTQIYILPFLMVLPMEWSWRASHLCRMVIINAIWSADIRGVEDHWSQANRGAAIYAVQMTLQWLDMLTILTRLAATERRSTETRLPWLSDAAVGALGSRGGRG